MARLNAPRARPGAGPADAVRERTRGRLHVQRDRAAATRLGRPTDRIRSTHLNPQNTRAARRDEPQRRIAVAGLRAGWAADPRVCEQQVLQVADRQAGTQYTVCERTSMAAGRRRLTRAESDQSPARPSSPASVGTPGGAVEQGAVGRHGPVPQSARRILRGAVGIRRGQPQPVERRRSAVLLSVQQRLVFGNPRRIGRIRRALYEAGEPPLGSRAAGRSSTARVDRAAAGESREPPGRLAGARARCDASVPTGAAREPTGAGRWWGGMPDSARAAVLRGAVSSGGLPRAPAAQARAKPPMRGGPRPVAVPRAPITASAGGPRRAASPEERPAGLSCIGCRRRNRCAHTTRIRLEISSRARASRAAGTPVPRIDDPSLPRVRPGGDSRGAASEGEHPSRQALWGAGQAVRLVGGGGAARVPRRTGAERYSDAG
jgi:hypothetical protein